MTPSQAAKNNVSPYSYPGIEVKISLQIIKEAVCDVFGLAMKDLDNPTRRREVVQARQLTHTLCRWILNWGLYKIGLNIGKRDHATVKYSIKTTKALYQTDKHHKECINRVLRIIHREDLKEMLLNTKEPRRSYKSAN